MRPIRRIVVAVDASPHSLAAIEGAAVLARLLEAELMGVYVEDIRLLRVAELPRMVEVNLYSHAARPFTDRYAEGQLKAQAAKARRALEEVVRRSRLRWSFAVRRGVVSAELIAAAQEGDLLTLGQLGWPLPGRRQLGSITAAVLSQTPAPVLIVRQGMRLHAPYLLLYDGSSPARRALSLAASLLPPGGPLLIASSDEMRHKQEVMQSLPLAVAYRTRLLPFPGPLAASLAAIVKAEGVGLVVLGAGALDWLLAIDTPLLVVQ
ncbi:MAG: universal stress protein [Truepera sp.]|nr:universal stress protein [Truepera sp.]